MRAPGCLTQTTGAAGPLLRSPGPAESSTDRALWRTRTGSATVASSSTTRSLVTEPRRTPAAP
eukprot:8627975-Pyramimonas_sp.AAC.1